MLLLISQQSIHYDMEDLIEQANEIQETMGRTYGVPDEVDEADLEAGACLRSEARTASRSSVLSIYRTRGVGYGSSGGGGGRQLSHKTRIQTAQPHETKAQVNAGGPKSR